MRCWGAVLILMLCSGCAHLSSNTSIDLLVGKKVSSDDFIGRDPSGIFRMYWNVGENSRIGYEHVSHWRDGQPFNDRKEDTIDQIFYSTYFGGRSTSYQPRVEISIGHKVKHDGFEGKNAISGIKLQQPVLIKSDIRMFFEYYYTKSGFIVDGSVDNLQQITYGVTFNNQ